MHMCFYSRLSCIHNTLSLSKKICELYKDLATFHEIFEPCVSLLERYFSLLFLVWLGGLIFWGVFFVLFVCVCFFLKKSYMSELLKKIFKRRLENCNFPLWNNWGFSWLVLDIPNLLDKKSTTEIWNSSKVYTLPWIFWSIFSCGLLLQVRLSF